MQALSFLAIAFFMGIVTSIYLPMNGAVGKQVGSALLANIPFYFLGTVTTLILFSFTRDFAAIPKLKEVPHYLYLSGFISAFLVLGSTWLLPKLGTGPFFVLFVAGQIIMALIVSHFGLLASPQDPITLRKLVGVAFLMTGVALSTLK